MVGKTSFAERGSNSGALVLETQLQERTSRQGMREPDAASADRPVHTVHFALPPEKDGGPTSANDGALIPAGVSPERLPTSCPLRASLPLFVGAPTLPGPSSEHVPAFPPAGDPEEHTSGRTEEKAQVAAAQIDQTLEHMESTGAGRDWWWSLNRSRRALAYQLAGRGTTDMFDRLLTGKWWLLFTVCITLVSPRRREGLSAAAQCPLAGLAACAGRHAGPCTGVAVRSG
jgi:hypothetical protein